MPARRYVYLVPGRDNVATAVDALAPGDRVEVEEIGTVVIRQAVPFGHKFATVPIRAGAPVVKYGHPIGLATSAIVAGDHVHVHNVEGVRGRGDRARKREG